MDKKNLFYYLILVIWGGIIVWAGPPGHREQRVMEAVRTDEPIKIDGLLKEKVWQEGGYSGFIQSEPRDGSPSTEKTIVWAAYDSKALYIASNSNFEFSKDFQVASACSFYEKNHPIFPKCE